MSVLELSNIGHKQQAENVAAFIDDLHQHTRFKGNIVRMKISEYSNIQSAITVTKSIYLYNFHLLKKNVNK